MTELEVGSRSVFAAVAQLEHGRLLQGQGARRRCQIVPKKAHASGGLRIQILLFEKSERSASNMINLRHGLADARHRSDFSTKDLHELGMDAGRVERFVKANPADVWVFCGASQEILEGSTSCSLAGLSFLWCGRI